MQWWVVLVLCFFTFGLAGLVWSFRQAAFVKKIDSGSRAMLFLGLTLAAIVLQAVLQLMIGSVSTTAMAGFLLIVIAALNLVILALGLIAIFGMRKSLVQYYNSVEPFGLQLNGVMTFFFSIFYFQYHLSRIAALKKPS